MAARILNEHAGHSARLCDTQITGPIAWTRDTLSAQDGVLPLDDACSRELADALAIVRSNPLPVLMLEPSAFELPACRALMARAKDQFERGIGFVLIDRLALHDYGIDDAKALYWVLAQHAELLPRLYRPFLFDRQREHAPDDPMVLEHPLFEYDGKRLTGRLSRAVLQRLMRA